MWDGTNICRTWFLLIWWNEEEESTSIKGWVREQRSVCAGRCAVAALSDWVIQVGVWQVGKTVACCCLIFEEECTGGSSIGPESMGLCMQRGIEPIPFVPVLFQSRCGGRLCAYMPCWCLRRRIGRCSDTNFLCTKHPNIWPPWTNVILFLSSSSPTVTKLHRLSRISPSFGLPQACTLCYQISLPLPRKLPACHAYYIWATSDCVKVKGVTAKQTTILKRSSTLLSVVCKTAAEADYGMYTCRAYAVTFAGSSLTRHLCKKILLAHTQINRRHYGRWGDIHSLVGWLVGWQNHSFITSIYLFTRVNES